TDSSKDTSESSSASLLQCVAHLFPGHFEKERRNDINAYPSSTNTKVYHKYSKKFQCCGRILRTQSLNVTGDGSDDDSFLDDVFVPFTDPSQFIEMLTHNSQLRKDN
ncbi:hypothetical protein OESDEN_19619, partial [Oesophagostomum dentatum]